MQNAIHDIWSDAAVVYVVLTLHVFAIIFYAIRKHQNLVSPMISGDVALPIAPDDATIEPAQDDIRMRMKALLVFILCAALVTLAVNWLPQAYRP